MFVGEKSRRVKKARKEVKRGRRGEDVHLQKAPGPAGNSWGPPAGQAARPGHRVFCPQSVRGGQAPPQAPSRSFFCFLLPETPGDRPFPPHHLRFTLWKSATLSCSSVAHVVQPLATCPLLSRSLWHSPWPQSSRKLWKNPKATASPGLDPTMADPAPPMGGWPGLPHPRLKIRALGTGDMASDPAPPVTSREALGKCVHLPVPQFPQLLAEGDR